MDVVVHVMVGGWWPKTTYDYVQQICNKNHDGNETLFAPLCVHGVVSYMF